MPKEKLRRSVRRRQTSPYTAVNRPLRAKNKDAENVQVLSAKNEELKPSEHMASKDEKASVLKTDKREENNNNLSTKEVVESKVNNEESDSKVNNALSDSDSDYEEYDASQCALSEFEALRKRNIETNSSLLQSLEIGKVKDEYNASANLKKRNEVGVKKKAWTLGPWGDTPRRVSMRLQNMPAKPMPELPKVELFRNTFYSPRKPSKLDMKAGNMSEEKGKEAMLTWSKMKVTKERKLVDQVSFKETVKKFDVKYVAKVTTDRIFSMAVHPSEDKYLVCAGDKTGNIGMWDVNCTGGKDTEVYLFSPHSRPINCLKFNPGNYAQLFSCSYDGTLRCADLSTQYFSQIVAFEEHEDRRFNYFSWPCNKPDTLLAAISDGDVVLCDTRTCKIEQTFEVFNKSARGIDCHPINENLFASNCYDGTLATFDLRQPSQQLSSFHHMRSSSTCFFSPVTGNKLLLTAQDDAVRVFNVDNTGKIECPPKWPIRHNNQTGRWLTTFRAAWDPKTDHSFVCGSMERPRQVDLFTCEEDGRLSSFSISSDEQTTITSINAFHPSRHLLATGNSSGRIHIWQ